VYGRVRVIVRGLVQGVGFRAFIMRQALRLGLKGYVRNLPDGSTVEIVAEGPLEYLEKLIDAARKGPPGARVDSVSVEYSEATGEYSDFSVI